MAMELTLKGLRRLGGINAEFDYKLANAYASRIRQFVKQMESHLTRHGAPLYTPFTDVTSQLEIDFSNDIQKQLDAFIAQKPTYSPSTKNACKWYLKELWAMDSGMLPQQNSIYEPLIQVLELGGDFYEHHGAICIRDVATLPYIRNQT
ncbi:hypothetical protein [Planctomicrobium piriforme]|uniref:Uncharacterized protein n=1 Tax=Planctomicrobium piriforme TaxID=1576369 RepID=A0A1I3HTD4_9PLAN|nr:hypothetical protein [Planctomicrobium piriforme]SFI38780.1 hypothetical protein SAMN05421753_108180 [Planctomicrobium piriforme]